MQYQQGRESKDPYFPVKEHQHQADCHQSINRKNNKEIPPRDVEIFMLQILIQIDPKTH